MIAWKKMAPEEMRVRLVAAERRLLGVEAENRELAAMARQAAKASLRLGDHRGYHHAARRYSLADRQCRMAGGMIEAIQGLRSIVAGQTSLNELVATGNEVRRVQESLGMDADALEEATRHVRTGMYIVNHAANQVNQMIKSVAQGEANNEQLDAIHEELLAEIEREATAGRRVKQELYNGVKLFD